MADDDPLPRALAHLDPVRRATLALLARRGLEEERVATLLGVDAAVVAERRRDALQALADEVGHTPRATWDELVALPAADWPGAAAPAPAPPAPEPVPEPEPEPDFALELDREPARAPAPAVAPEEPRRGRRRTGAIAIGALVLLAALVVVVALVAAGGGSSASTPARTEAAATTPPATAATPAAAPATTTPAGAGPSATLAADGRSVALRLPGLPQGTYAVWLFDTLLENRRVGTLGADGTLDVRLPADARSFALLDVSRQPAGERRHSGESVLRVPVADLRPGRAVALTQPPL